jgi:uncharacterized membrane protein YeaQ/YmgE (transglycosylase-associated protein family)
MGGNIRESTALEVGVLRIVLLGILGNVVVEVVVHRERLVPGTAEVVAESAGTAVPSNFRSIGLSTTNCGDEGAGARECRSELGLVGAVIGHACRADS